MSESRPPRPCPTCGTATVLVDRVIVQPEKDWRCQDCAHSVVTRRLKANERVTTVHFDGSITASIKEGTLKIIDHCDNPSGAEKVGVDSGGMDVWAFPKDWP